VWPIIRILDGDLAQSGELTTKRDDFKIYRVSEAIAVGLAIAKGLGWDDSATLGFMFRWRKLKGLRTSAGAPAPVRLGPPTPRGQPRHLLVGSPAMNSATRLSARRLSSEMLIDPFGLVEALRAVSKWFVPRKLSTRCSCLMAFQ
jgi:hypothetical protein